MYIKLLWGIHLPRENSDKHTYLITVFKTFYSTGLCIKNFYGAYTRLGRILTNTIINYSFIKPFTVQDYV